MSLLSLLFLLLVSLAIISCLDGLPELVLGWLLPPSWVSWLGILAIAAWLTGE
ncbi:MAG: hypothetical protein HC886_20120 [Leptolyngbyaceae cyanobacterium SM1_1_3]|nr:hypothetical protein [Leptolyngbyaceae cyanobacterium SM1_1_3]NJN04540.1 hypothetical protein [Leptolyngbyaceae cyanobacterium RM1_1_2]NJO08413.1 hypothetical protein [Leptolyngbyaceae cyanobacterium SL_1_1]